MTDLIIYLIQSSIVFSCLYILYKVVVSRLTFHKTNRFVLLSLPVVSLLAPFSYLAIPEVSSTIIQIPKLNEFVVASENMVTETITNTNTKSFSMNMLFSYAYTFGCALILVKLVHSVWLIVHLKNKSRFKMEENYHLVFTDRHDTFSFLNWIFVSKHIKNTANNNLIIEHEKAHVQLRHTIDILFSEVYIMFFWFNPLVYLYRKSLKSIHEYQADAYVLQTNIKTSNYLQALLQNIETEMSNTLYSYFNQSVIKKRIDMITKNPTTKLYKFTYLAFIIGSLFLCMAFTKPDAVNELITNSLPQLSPITVEKVSTPPSLFPVKNRSKKDITSLYGRTRKHLKTGQKNAHQGIDIRASIGTPVIATADGVIAKASDENDWGNLIIINHANGYQTWYAHLKGFNVSEKQSVAKGDIIGYVGNTGLSTGPHLHYEVRLNDTHLNPLDFIKE